MNTRQIGKSFSLLQTNHGDEVLFSGVKPLAGFSPLLGYYKTAEDVTLEEAKHMRKYLKNVRQPVVVTQEQIEALFL